MTPITSSRTTPKWQPCEYSREADVRQQQQLGKRGRNSSRRRAGRFRRPPTRRSPRRPCARGSRTGSPPRRPPASSSSSPPTRISTEKRVIAGSASFGRVAGGDEQRLDELCGDSRVSCTSERSGAVRRRRRRRVAGNEAHAVKSTFTSWATGPRRRGAADLDLHRTEYSSSHGSSPIRLEKYSQTARAAASVQRDEHPGDRRSRRRPDSPKITSSGWPRRAPHDVRHDDVPFGSGGWRGRRARPRWRRPDRPRARR